MMCNSVVNWLGLTFVSIYCGYTYVGFVLFAVCGAFVSCCRFVWFGCCDCVICFVYCFMIIVYVLVG